MAVLAQTDIGNALEEFGRTLARVLPQVVVFLLILIIGYLIARAIGRIVDRVLGRVGFDRLVERGGVGRAMARTRYEPSDIIGKIVFYGLMLFVLQLAFGVFGDNPISELIRGVIAYLPNIIVAIIIIVVAAAIAAVVKEVIEASLGGLSWGRGLAFGASVAILVIGVFAALDQLQVAPNVVNTLFIGLVAIVVGSAIVAIGGGGVMPMREVWERSLNRAQNEAPRVREEARGSSERIRDRAEERADQARQATSDTGLPSDTRPPAGTTGSTATTGTTSGGASTSRLSDDETRPVAHDSTERLPREPLPDERDASRRGDAGDLTQPLRQPRYDDEPPPR
jgi:mechanosensitive ion channel-like protein